MLYQERIPTFDENAEADGCLEVKRIEIAFPDKESDCYIESHIKKPNLLFWELSKKEQGLLDFVGQEEISFELADKFKKFIENKITS